MPFEKIRKLIEEQFSIDAEKITMDSNFVQDLNADSLDIVELIMAIEEEFDVTIEDEDIEKIATVSDVVNYIKTKKQ